MDSRIIYTDEAIFNNNKRNNKAWVHKYYPIVLEDAGRIKSINLLLSCDRDITIYNEVQSVILDGNGFFIYF